MRKKPFSLIEISIGLFLLSIVMYALFSNLHLAAASITRMRKMSEKEYAKAFFDLKIARMIENLAAEPALAIFDYQQNKQALSFIYEAPLHRNSQLMGHVVSVLYKNDQGKLCLVTYQGKAKKSVAHEILLDKVSSFSASFFDPQQGLWTLEPKTIDMVKITLVFADQEQEEFVYFIRENELKLAKLEGIS